MLSVALQHTEKAETFYGRDIGAQGNDDETDIIYSCVWIQ